MQKPIGILGGTFDPIHHGHLRIALETYQQFDLQEVRLIPCQIPVLKKPAQATAQQRLAMLKLAIKNQPGLRIDDRELKRRTPSYTVDTLNSLRADFPKTPLWLILGSDTLQELNKWHRWQELIQIAHFVLISRPGYTQLKNGVIAKLIQQHLCHDIKILKKSLAGKIFVADFTHLDISATMIRTQTKNGFSPRYLLPDSVVDYIDKKDIYK